MRVVFATASCLQRSGALALADRIVAVSPHDAMRLAVLGSGDAGLAARRHELAASYPDSLAFVDGYDEALSHLMFTVTVTDVAGTDPEARHGHRLVVAPTGGRVGRAVP